MSLSACSRHSFSTRARTLGAAYHQIGQAEIVDRGRNDATVELSAGRERCIVEVDWSEAFVDLIYAKCTCGAAGGNFPCPHVWAAMMALDAAGVTGYRPLTGKERTARTPAELARLLSGESPVVEDGPAPEDMLPRELWRYQLPDASSPPQRRESGMLRRWRQETQERCVACYVLNVMASRQAGKLVVDLYYREMKKNGEFGRPKPLKVRSGSVPKVSDPADVRILQQLLGNEAETDGSYRTNFQGNYAYSYSAYAHFAITPTLYEVTLPLMSDTGRLTWVLDDHFDAAEGHPIRWDDGEPWRFRVIIISDAENECWKLEGQLYRGDETVPLDQPVLLLARGLVLFPDSLARLDAEADFAWISCLRENSPIQVPFQDRESLLARMFQTPTVPRIELPDDLQLTAVEGSPQGRLSVKAPSARGNLRNLMADVAFLYNGLVVGIADQRSTVFDSEGQRVIRRDPAAEQRLLDQLTDAGIQPTGRYESNHGNVCFPVRSLTDVVDRMTGNGWIVESEGQRIRRPGSVQMKVNSGIDWFELDGSVDFDGVKATLPQLLKAARDKQRYVRLDDGTCGMLPEDWLKKFGGLIELGEQDEDTLKFSSCQALLLDALLAAQDDVQVDATFERLRERLRSFDGVQPAKQPRGFSGELRAYQREGVGWLHFLRDFGFGGCLADDMGLGKTIQVLALLQSRRLRRMPRGEKRRPSLAVVPKSLVFNWISEAKRFTPRLRVMDYTGSERAEKLEQLDKHDLLITTYGLLRRDILQLKDIHFDYAILDESQAIKNAGSQVAKASRLLKADHRLAMTGTPVENHLGELWSLFEFLNPGMLGRSTVFQSLTKQGADEDNQSLSMLASAVKPFMLRRTKEQVLTELPQKTEQTLYCEMLPKQRKMYEELRDYYRASLSKRVEETGLDKAKIHVLEALLRLRQAACHPGLVDPKRRRDPSAKLELLLEQLDEIVDEGHKALVFSQFTSLLAIVRDRFDRRKIPYAYLDGKTRKREQAVKRFQEDPDCPLFLISLKAGGHGLNLTAADYVYILDPWWNPAVEAQAIDRAHRIGQTQSVFAYRLICRDTVEDKILELQKEKRELAEAIVTADNSLIRNLTASDLQQLLS